MLLRTNLKISVVVLLIGLFSFSAHAERDFAREAMEMMISQGRDAQPSLDNLKKISNEYQVRVLEALISGDYEIYNKFPELLSVDNAESARALIAMIRNDWDILPSLSHLVKIKNKYQADAVEILVSGRDADYESYEIANKFPELLEIDNRFAVRALKEMVQDHRDILPSFSELVKVRGPIQASAVVTLVNGRTYEFESYEVAPKMSDVLKMSNPLQLKALRALVAAGVGVAPSMELIPQITTKKQVELVQMMAKYRTLNKSILFAFKEPNEKQIEFLKVLLNAEVDASVFEVVVNRMDRVKYDFQVEALKYIDSHNYSIDVNIIEVLQISNQAQLDLVKFLIDERMPLNLVFPQILKITNNEQVVKIKSIIQRKWINTFVARRFGITSSAFKGTTFGRIIEAFGSSNVNICHAFYRKKAQ